ncbi:MAG: MoxR family ATPase [Elusimicrobiota bacterium]
MSTLAKDSVAKLLEGMNKALVGKEEAVLMTLVTLVARGHLLIEDVPGIGKTLLGLALARSLSASFKRIQFTNDLLPSDILGLSVFSQKEGRFDFRPGPIFSNVVLADEINRSTPKTQSALLEAMNERQVSIDGRTYPLDEPFFVIATENPVEYHGTFPLPEAQLDRFLARVQIGYPSPEDERRVVQGGDLPERLKAVEPTLSMSELLALQKQVEGVRMEESLVGYVVAIANHTRASAAVKLGLSPRGSQALCRAAKAFALISGRDYCVPDDIKRVAVPVIGHRVVLDSAQYGMAKVTESERFVLQVLQEVPVPL